MARSEDDPRNPGKTRSEIQLDSVQEPILSESPVNPGTEPHTTPALTTADRRTTEPGPAGSPASASAVYDDRKQTATDPHAGSGGAARDTADGPGIVDQLLASVEPRPANTGTMGASGEHARWPERER